MGRNALRIRLACKSISGALPCLYLPHPSFPKVESHVRYLFARSDPNGLLGQTSYAEGHSDARWEGERQILHLCARPFGQVLLPGMAPHCPVPSDQA